MKNFLANAKLVLGCILAAAFVCFAIYGLFHVFLIIVGDIAHVIKNA